MYIFEQPRSLQTWLARTLDVTDVECGTNKVAKFALC